jgi:hypothetical protein
MPPSASRPAPWRCTSLLTLGLAGACTPTVTSQVGSVMAPRPAAGDGQPIGTGQRVEAHFGAGAARGKPDRTDDATAVDRQDGGVAVFWALSPDREIGLVADAAWSPASEFLSGTAATAAPSTPAVASAFALRQSFAFNPRFRLGLNGELGLSSQPLTVAGGTERDVGLLLRAAVVPSLRLAPITASAIIGIATESYVPAVVQRGSEGVRTSLAAAVGLGASLDLGPAARLGLRVTQSGGNAGSYTRGELTASFDFGRPAAPRR